MLAFAANSLLCREALATGEIGAASFTLVRILSGAVTLSVLLLFRSRSFTLGGSWGSAAALFGYAAGFSYAYLTLSAGTGALLLFGAVQVTMIGYGLSVGERLNLRQSVGVLIATTGHHIKHWAQGGETKLDNMIQLCQSPHRLLHEGQVQVKRSCPGRL